MKLKYYKGIFRKNSKKWLGWKIIDFYNGTNMTPSLKEEKLLQILTENYLLIEEIKKLEER